MYTARDLMTPDPTTVRETATVREAVQIFQTLDSRHLMSSDTLSVDMDTDASEIAELMLENKIGAVPVTDIDGRLVGIVSYVDLLRRLSFDDSVGEAAQ